MKRLGTWQVDAVRIPKYFLRTREDGATHTEAGHIPGGRSLRDLVFGANDGLVAAFAVVSGVHGAAVSTRIVLLAGLAERARDSRAARSSRSWSTSPPTRNSGWIR